MEIYNERMAPVENPDLRLGWLEDSVRRVTHEATPAVREVWHYETVAEYPNGGRDVARVVDVPGVSTREAWEESIPIRIYHPYTQEERLQRMEEAMSSVTATLAQVEADVRTALAWLTQKEA